MIGKFSFLDLDLSEFRFLNTKYILFEIKREPIIKHQIVLKVSINYCEANDIVQSALKLKKKTNFFISLEFNVLKVHFFTIHVSELFFFK